MKRAVVGALLLLGTAPLAAQDPACADPVHRQFDFWIGDWDIEQEFPQPDGSVIQLPARSTVTRELRGCALIERWHGRVQYFWEGMTAPDTLIALSVRAYDDVDRVWRIHWMDTRAPRRWIDGGFAGGFEAGVGVFLSAAGPDGVSTRRIRFLDVGPDSLVWDLPVRTPAGDWLTVWRMRFRRRTVPADADALAITGVHVVPMTGDTILRDHSVLIRNGSIVGIGPADRFELPAGIEVLEARGRFLAPGLIDFHVHLRSRAELDSYLRHGVTTVVSMRGSRSVVALRDSIRSGQATGPRIFTTGPLLDGDPPIFSGSGTEVVTTSAAARAAIADHVAAGYDMVKVYNNLDPDVLATLVDVARANRMAVVGHLPRRPVRELGLRRALDAGIDMIAHGEEVFFTHFGGAPDSLMRQGRYAPPTSAQIDEAARLIRDAGVAVTPNLSFIAMTARMLEDVDAVFADSEFERLSPDVRTMWREQNPTRRANLEAFAARERIKYDVVRRLTRALDEAGVPLLVGTDASAPGMYPGASAHLEIAELIDAGLSPFSAITAGTGTAGRFLGQHVADAPRLGIIETGAAADVLILDADPLEDPATLSRPWRVLVAGRVVHSRR